MSRMEILKWVLWILLLSRIGAARSLCTGGCTLAYGAYRVKEKDTVDNIVKFFPPVTTADVQQYSGLPNANFIRTGSLLKIPFTCDCINGNFLGHNFVYAIQSGDTYEKISDHYSNLTSSAWLQATNSYPETRIPDTGNLNVTINCSCGNAEISPNYGLFLTYPLTAGDNVSGLSSQYNVTADLLQKYNPSVDFKLGSGLVFIPVQDLNGSYRYLSPSSKGLAVGAIAGISVAVIIVALFLAAFLWIAFAKRRKQKDGQLIPSDSGIEISKQTFGSLNRSDEFGVSLGPSGITVDKSVEFTYEELAEATNDFSMANKIGQGGFGAVYYAELRGEQAAVKRMEMESSSSTESFLAELKVLTRVHHVNLGPWRWV